MNKTYDSSSVEKRLLAIDPIALPEQMNGIEAAWLYLPEMPMEAEFRAELAEMLRLLRRRIQDKTKDQVTLDVYLQMTQLQRPSGSQLLSRNGPRWLPEIGMGVWPDREPPRSLNEEDFKNLAPGQKLVETEWPVMRIGVEEETIQFEVLSAMTGSGASLVLFTGKKWAEAHRVAVSLHLQGLISDDVLKGYPMFVPLLDAKSIATIGKQEIENCLSDVLVYMREDLATRAILIVSRLSLTVLFPEHFSIPAEAN